MGTTFWNLGRVVAVAMSVAVLAPSTFALADGGVFLGYSVTFDINYPPVDPNNPTDTPTLTDVVLYTANEGPLGGCECDPDWTGPSQPLQIVPSEDVQTLVTPDYPPFQTNAVSLFAIYTDPVHLLEQHLVIAMTPEVATAVAGQSLSATFPGTQNNPFEEDTLISDVEELNSFDRTCNDDDAQCLDALTELSVFADIDLLGGERAPILGDPSLEGLPFTRGIASIASFDLVSFSDGSIVGSGTASVVAVFGPGGSGGDGGSTGSVPEPSTWIMMAIGFAGLGFAGHRRARIAAAI